MSKVSGKKWFGPVVLLLSLFAGTAAGDIIVPSASKVPQDFRSALGIVRSAVLEYEELHGYLPDVVSSDWVLEDNREYEGARKFFVEATRGGKLAVSVVTDGAKTTRLIGVFGGNRMNDGKFREYLAEEARKGLYGVGNTPYRADCPAVYIRLERTEKSAVGDEKSGKGVPGSAAARRGIPAEGASADATLSLDIQVSSMINNLRTIKAANLLYQVDNKIAAYRKGGSLADKFKPYMGRWFDGSEYLVLESAIEGKGVYIGLAKRNLGGDAKCALAAKARESALTNWHGEPFTASDDILCVELPLRQ